MRHSPTRVRAQRHWPTPRCPRDLRRARLFHAPLQRSLVAGATGNPTFVRATAATYEDQDTDQVTDAASGQERFESNGYLAEGQRTNLLFPSDDFEDAAWTNTNVTVLASQAGVGGEAGAASKLTAAAGNATLINDLGVIGSAAISGALYIERVTGTGDIDLTLDGGSTWTTVAVSSTFTRFSIQQTLANPDFGIRIVTTGDEVLVQASQPEAGTFPSSHIPTTVATATRNADTLTWSTTGNFNAAKGVIYCEADILAAAGPARGIVSIDSGNTNNTHYLTVGATEAVSAVIRSGGSGQATVLSSSVMAAGVPARLAEAYNTDDFELYFNGASEGTPDTSGTVPASLTTINVGSNPFADAPFVHVRNFQTFSEDLSGFEVARIR